VRREARDQLFDLALGLFRGGGGDLLDVRLRQMRPQQDERRQMELAALDSLEQRGEALHQPGRRDAPERCPLAHPETPRTEVEHRGARGAEIEPPLLDFDEVHDHPRGQRMTFGAERR